MQVLVLKRLMQEDPQAHELEPNLSSTATLVPCFKKKEKRSVRPGEFRIDSNI